MRRGSIVIAATRGELTGKPRPYVVVQRETTLADSTTVTACPITTGLFGTGQARIPIGPGDKTGLVEQSEIQISRIQTLRRTGVRQVVGKASPATMTAVDQALKRWLDI